MQHLITSFRILICFFCFLIPTSRASASHIVGADLTYAWVTGNTYKVTLAVYADCGPASASVFPSLFTATPEICVYDGSTYSGSFSLAVQPPSTGTEVTPPLCPGDSSQCASMTSATPGITLFIYSGNYTLPSASAAWHFHFSGNYVIAAAGRAAAITNISGAGGTWIELDAMLNNTVSHNTNPVLNIIPLPYYAINMLHNYNPVAIDAEGDSLVYALVPATSVSSVGSCSIGSSVTYAYGTTATNPLQVAPGTFSFNTFTGQVSFYPNVLQRGVVVYDIEEYRAGVLIGSLQRELTILINSSSNHLPGGIFSAPVACTLIDTTTILVCDTVGSFSVNIPGADADAADTIYVTPFAMPAGATFSVAGNGTPHPVSTFSWSTATAAPGVYTFFLKYADNSCPMSGMQTIAYTVIILDCSLIPPTAVQGNTVTSNSPRIYPNPSRGDFILESPVPFYHAAVTVTDIYGRVLKNETPADNSSKVSLDLDHLPDGVYSLTVQNGNRIFHEKISIVR